MKNIYINDVDQWTGLTLYSRQRNVDYQNKSPWLTAPGHRKGKILSLRPNAFSFLDRETSRGTLLRIFADPEYAQDRFFSPTASQSQFFGYLQQPDGFVGWDDERERAIAKWYNKAGGFSTNVAELYATRKQTVEMVTSLTYRIARAAGYVARRKYKLACEQLGITYKRPKRGTNPPEVWLEYNYGWVPLVTDIYRTINNPWPDVYKIVTSRHTARSSNVVFGSYGSIRNARWSNSYKVKYSVVGKVTVLQTALAAASQKGVTNPASLGWELLPFSFVVDWFLPIGPYLENLTALGGCQISDNSVTKTETNIAVGTAETNQQDSIFRNVQFSTSRRTHRKVRSLEGLNLPLPRLKNPISLQRFSYALSLLSLNMEAIRKAGKR